MSSPGDSYKYQEIVLDSGDYKHGDTNRPIFQFDQHIDDSQYFQVHRVTIPTTYYVFDATRNTMTVDGNGITWPPGNYTASEWIAEVTPLLPAGITVSYDPITNKLTFESAAPFTILFDAANEVDQQGGLELGFRNDVLYNSVNNGLVWVIPSEFAVNFSGPNFVYLRSSLASVFNNNSIIFSNTTVTSTGGDILAMIPVTENRNSVVHYVDDSDQFLQWPDVGNKRVELYFTLGRRTDALNFNGHTFQVQFNGYSLKENAPYRYNY